MNLNCAKDTKNSNCSLLFAKMCCIRCIVLCMISCHLSSYVRCIRDRTCCTAHALGHAQRLAAQHMHVSETWVCPWCDPAHEGPWRLGHVRARGITGSPYPGHVAARAQPQKVTWHQLGCVDHASSSDSLSTHHAQAYRNAPLCLAPPISRLGG